VLASTENFLRGFFRHFLRNNYDTQPRIHSCLNCKRFGGDEELFRWFVWQLLLKIFSRNSLIIIDERVDFFTNFLVGLVLVLFGAWPPVWASRTCALGI
jgi:hypothetical protein